MQVVLDEAEITNIAVDEGMRGRHIATALINELVKICHNKKVIYLHLEVRLSNTPARNLYEKCDFVIDGVRKNFYDKPKEDAILMTKTLEEV